MRNSHKATVKKYSTGKNNTLRKRAIGGILFLAVAKSTAERGNSIYLLTANSSTPFKRAFFVRGLRTPKENQTPKGAVILSMVGRNGQRLIVGCFPLVAVFHPVTFYRQAWKLAVDIQKLLTEFSTMLFKFLSIQNGKTLKITVRADSEEQARIKHGISDTTLCVARYTDAFLAKKQAILSTEQNHSLPSVQNADNLESTETKDGNRNRYTSGIFLPKIHQINGNTKPLIYSEFAVRATPRNKAETIRTNKGGYSLVAVEPLSHPFSDKPLSLTKTKDTMNKPTQTPKGIIAKLTAFPFVLSAEKGACYA
ncbi:ash family protein [Bibersteinia trehalosi]|uniref:ash family protein n=1 Tax=Bibersteinia trehalosi TaxID=47735 RepID=UPI003D274049